MKTLKSLSMTVWWKTTHTLIARSDSRITICRRQTSMRRIQNYVSLAVFGDAAAVSSRFSECFFCCVLQLKPPRVVKRGSGSGRRLWWPGKIERIEDTPAAAAQRSSATARVCRLFCTKQEDQNLSSTFLALSLCAFWPIIILGSSFVYRTLMMPMFSSLDTYVGADEVQLIFSIHAQP